MATWQEFLEKLKAYKKEYVTGQVNLNAGSLASLVYAGAFDAMVGHTPSLDEYHTMAEELKIALNSKAQPQKAKKGDLYGVADIDSPLLLDLWRNQVNPLHTFNFANTLKAFLKEHGFKPLNGGRIATHSSETYNAFLINSWTEAFENAYARGKIVGKKSPHLAALLGVIKEVNIKKLKDGRESLIFKMHLDSEMTGNIRVWPNENGFVEYQYTSTILPGKVGLAVIRLDDSWNGYRQGSLVEWKQVRL